MQFIDMIKDMFASQVIIGLYIFSFTYFDFLVQFFLPFILTLILYKIVKRGIIRSLENSKFVEEKKLIGTRLTKIILRLILLALTIIYIINLLGAKITEYLAAFLGILTHPIVEDISITTIMLIIPIVYLARLGGNIAQKFANSSVLPYFKIPISQSRLTVAILKNIVFVLVMLFGLTIIGFNLSLLYGVFGVIGIGIGFGLQGVVANLFAGFILLVTKPVKIGDHIIVDGKEGDLAEIRFVNSIISTIEHETIIIPNTKLIDNPVHNYSFDDRHIKIRNAVQVSYDTDLEVALDILYNIAKRSEYTLDGEEVITRVNSFDDSGITISVISWIDNSSNKYAGMSWVNLEIWKAFKNANIEIPFPQLDLKIKR